MTPDASLDRLRQQFPWPSEKPPVVPVHWSMDGGGRQIIKNVIRKHNVQLILEVGVFLGGSVRTWLGTSPDVVVLAVDPWEPPWGQVAHFFDRPEIAEQLDRENGPYETFLASLWDYRDRIIPIRGYSPDVLHAIASAGVKPQLLYLDGDKLGQEIEICSKLFPGIMISGDDWLHSDQTGFPIRKPVREFCQKHAKHLRVDRQTWLIGDRPSLLDLVKKPIGFGQSAERRIRHLRKHLLGRFLSRQAA